MEPENGSPSLTDQSEIVENEAIHEHQLHPDECKATRVIVDHFLSTLARAVPEPWPTSTEHFHHFFARSSVPIEP